MTLIGYWRDIPDEHIDCPEPNNLVKAEWIEPGDKARLVRYLLNGLVYESYRGYSYCRFNCGIDFQQMGSRDFTDGCWVWPEGLAHYVKKHDVALPNDFVQSCRAAKWKIPVAFTRTPEDLTFWKEWAAHFTRSSR